MDSQVEGLGRRKNRSQTDNVSQEDEAEESDKEVRG
jgi:hypothetical protein